MTVKNVASDRSDTRSRSERTVQVSLTEDQFDVVAGIVDKSKIRVTKNSVASALVDIGIEAYRQDEDILGR